MEKNKLAIFRVDFRKKQNYDNFLPSEHQQQNFFDVETTPIENKLQQYNNFYEDENFSKPQDAQDFFSFSGELFPNYNKAKR